MLQHKLNVQIVFCGLRFGLSSLWLKKSFQNWINQKYFKLSFQLTVTHHVRQRRQKKESSDAISQRCDRKTDNRCHPGRGSVWLFPLHPDDLLPLTVSVCPFAVCHANCKIFLMIWKEWQSCWSFWCGSVGVIHSLQSCWNKFRAPLGSLKNRLNPRD